MSQTWKGKFTKDRRLRKASIDVAEERREAEDRPTPNGNSIYVTRFPTFFMASISKSIK